MPELTLPLTTAPKKY